MKSVRAIKVDRCSGPRRTNEGHEEPSNPISYGMRAEVFDGHEAGLKRLHGLFSAIVGISDGLKRPDRTASELSG